MDLDFKQFKCTGCQDYTTSLRNYNISYDVWAEIKPGNMRCPKCKSEWFKVVVRT